MNNEENLLELRWVQRTSAIGLAIECASDYGAFDKRLTSTANNQENLGEHWEAVVSLADAIFDYTTQDEKIDLSSSEAGKPNLVLLASDAYETE